MDKRARERDKEKGPPPAKGRLVEGQITTYQIQDPGPAPPPHAPTKSTPTIEPAYTENWTSLDIEGVYRTLVVAGGVGSMVVVVSVPRRDGVRCEPRTMPRSWAIPRTATLGVVFYRSTA